MTKRHERRNKKVIDRSRKRHPYQPRPPLSDPESVWTTIETLLSQDRSQSVAEEVLQVDEGREADRCKSKRRRSRYFKVLDVASGALWIAMLTKLFIADIDRIFLNSVAPQLNWILDMRWLVVLVLIALIFLIFKRRVIGMTFAYVAFFPFVVLFWKIPKVFVNRPNKVAASAFAGLITGFISRIKFYVLAIAIGCVSGALILSNSSSVIILIGIIGMLFALVWWLTVTAKDLLRSSAFIRAQERAIEWLFGFSFIELLTSPDQPDQLQLKRWSVDDARKFRDSAGNAVLIRQALLFWAGAVDQYRKGPAAIVLNGALVLFLLVLVAVSFSFINFGVYVIDPSHFRYDTEPEPWTFAYYSIVAITFGEIAALAPESGLAVLSKLANGIVGGVGVISFIGSNLIGYRRARAESSPDGAASRLREKATELENLSTFQYQMSLTDLEMHLKAASWGMFGALRWLTTRTQGGSGSPSTQ